MDPPVPLLRCPGCGQALDATEVACPTCGGPGAATGVLDTVQDLEGAAEAVTTFYGHSPFPGYAAGDDAATLIDRGMRSGFVRALDATIAADARVLDLGCGTGQLAMVLALRGRGRTVVGADLTREQLSSAAWFRDRASVDNLHLVRADLFSVAIADHAFDVVICRGVVHHTDDPIRAIHRAADRVAPGGLLVLGYYDRVGRAPHMLRVGLSRALGGPIAALDPILRQATLDPDKRRNWIRDQYEHPVEHRLSLASVAETVEAAGLQWVRSVPPLPRSSLRATTRRPGALGRAALTGSWAAAGLNDPDAGLVAVVAHRPSRT